MKHIKLFEKPENGCWVVIEMENGVPEYIQLFIDKESADNYLINSIHQYFKDEEETEEYSCKDIFDVNQLLETWNEKQEYNGEETYYQFITYFDKVELRPELKMRMDAKKYNL